MKAGYIITAISLILSILCIVIYNIIGSYVAGDGTLVEPFYLIVFNRLFFFISIISFVIVLIKKLKKK